MSRSTRVSVIAFLLPVLPTYIITGCDGTLADDQHEVLTDLSTGALRTGIDPRRSLVVTEQTILERFSFTRVMEHLVASSGVSQASALGLYQQWWDTQNPGPSLALGPHCDDQRDALGGPALNGFPYDCRTEGLLASEDPFTAPAEDPAGYVPLGLFNRFDLAPADGSHCGEYRVVFGRRPDPIHVEDRNLIIFEAVMPNPHPTQGLKGCRKVVHLWAGLSSEDDPARRADRLEQLYFEGFANIPAVLNVDHLGAGPEARGQIRTNQLVVKGGPRVWTLREFKLERARGVDGEVSALVAMPQTVKGNPFGPLFASGETAPALAADFQDHLITQLPALARGSLTSFDYQVPDRFNTGQSHSSGSNENRYLVQMALGGGALGYRLDAALAESGLTGRDVVARAQALSCAGCHRLNDNVSLGGGLTWPKSLGFVHVSDRQLEPSVDGPRWLISPALTDVFLPRRQEVLETYLADKPFHVNRPGDPIGGRRVH